MLVKAVSTLVESRADVSMNDSEFRSEIIVRVNLEMCKLKMFKQNLFSEQEFVRYLQSMHGNYHLDSCKHFNLQ